MIVIRVRTKRIALQMPRSQRNSLANAKSGSVENYVKVHRPENFNSVLHRFLTLSSYITNIMLTSKEKVLAEGCRISVKCAKDGSKRTLI